MRKYVPYPRRQFIRRILKAGVAMAFGVLADIRVNGRENLPKDGPLIVVGNHFHFLDPLMFVHLLPYPAEFIGGAKMPNAPAATHFLQRMFGVIPTARGTVSRDTLYSAESILKQNGVLAIFPEGGSWATVLRPPRPGAAFLATMCNAPILPVGLNGLTDVFPKFRRGKRATVHMNIGKPFGPYYVSERGESDRGRLEEIGHEIMRRVAELVSPPERGFYSEDPQIRESARGTEIYPWAGNPEL